LNESALNAGLLFGAAAGPPPLSDPAYQALYLQHCGIITTDIALKWLRVRPTRDMVPVFGPADDLINWALANDIKVKGHNSPGMKTTRRGCGLQTPQLRTSAC
jgi:endo-1,4-beta-xylanase